MRKHIVMVLAGAASYGMLSSFAKIAYGQGYTAAEMTFAQALTGGSAIAILIINFSAFKNSAHFDMGLLTDHGIACSSDLCARYPERGNYDNTGGGHFTDAWPDRIFKLV